MSVLNFSTPYLASPSTVPPLPPYYHQPATSPRPPLNLLQGPYSYPQPEKPFLREEYPNYKYNNQLPNQHSQQHNNQPNYHQHHHQQPEFTKVEDDGTRTKVHAVIDYDEYEDDDNQSGGGVINGGTLEVTPIQGPIFIKNGSVPVIPLYSHPVVNNGTFVQIPILWTALSIALGLELRGEYIRGVPCIKRNQQLFCPTAGKSYPIDQIELFIDENKALMKRMYGEFEMSSPPQDPSGKKRKRSLINKPGIPDLHFDPGINLNDEKIRNRRQNFRNNQSTENGRMDACESKLEIVTPLWASNSAGKIRAIVNTQHFEQAIHQETCSKVNTKHCTNNCGCEQKYKWHRLLAYDPENDCKGIFMDWFLFPSCCVCRCSPT